MEPSVRRLVKNIDSTLELSYDGLKFIILIINDLCNRLTNQSQISAIKSERNGKIKQIDINRAINLHFANKTPQAFMS